MAYGHSIIVDPYGKVLVDAGEEEGIIYHDITPDVIESARNSIFVRRHKRKEIYD